MMKHGDILSQILDTS